MTVHVFGASGRLGRSLITCAGASAQAVPIEAYRGRDNADITDVASRYFDEHAQAGDLAILAFGLTDPALSENALFDANFRAPCAIMTAASRRSLKCVAIGSVSEHFAARENPYAASKRRLADWIRDRIDRVDDTLLYLRLHTLYGVGKPLPHMFLGQIAASLEAGRPFKMTSGVQFREYHHYSDGAAAMLDFSQSPRVGAADLNTGARVRLAELATAIFDKCGRPDLLQIGALPDPEQDNFTDVFEPTPGVNAASFRDPLTGVPDYLQRCLQGTYAEGEP